MQPYLLNVQADRFDVRKTRKTALQRSWESRGERDFEALLCPLRLEIPGQTEVSLSICKIADLLEGQKERWLD